MPKDDEIIVWQNYKLIKSYSNRAVQNVLPSFITKIRQNCGFSFVLLFNISILLEIWKLYLWPQLSLPSTHNESLSWISKYNGKIEIELTALLQEDATIMYLGLNATHPIGLGWLPSSTAILFPVFTDHTCKCPSWEPESWAGLSTVLSFWVLGFVRRWILTSFGVGNPYIQWCKSGYSVEGYNGPKLTQKFIFSSLRGMM